MHKAIEEARQAGHEDDDILKFMMSRNPDIEKSATDALQSGYTSTQMLDYLSAVTKEGKLSGDIPEGNVLPQGERGIKAGFKRGLGRGASGLPFADEQVERDEGFLEHLGGLAGETISDLPAMFAGGAVGGLAGGAVGGPIGSVLGGGAGAFAAPATIKQAFAEYREHVRNGLDLTFGEFLERVGRVGATGLKSGIVGAATSQAARLLPILRNMPGLKKLLSTKAGKVIEKPLATLAAITGSQAAVEFKIPSLQEIGDNVAVMLGFELTTVGLNKVRGVMKKKGIGVQEAVNDIGKEVLKKEKVVEETVEKAKEKKPEPKPKPTDKKEQALAKKENKLDRDIRDSEANNKRWKERIDELEQKKVVPHEDIKLIQSIIKDSEKIISKNQKELAKIEAARKKVRLNEEKKLREESEREVKKEKPKIKKIPEPEVEPKKSESPRQVLEDAIPHMPKSVQKLAKKALGRFDRFKDEQSYFKILRKHVDKMRSGTVESEFKWRETFADAEKKHGKRFTPKEREEMLYYRQQTGNPNIKGDTFETLSKRLPSEAKKVVETAGKHMEKWLERWNENPVTRNINPREGLEEIYLPGFYEEPKGGYKKILNLVSKQFKTKNPLSNKKTFLSYNEALIKAGLKPKFKDLGQLMHAYDKLMLRLEANNELLDTIKQQEKKTGSKLIVTPSDGAMYNKAKKGGWVPFDDVFLRRYVSGETPDGKLQYATHASPALMHPDMAPAMVGMFRKDAFKSDAKFWQWYDAANAVMKTSRVIMSPFHYVALAEAGVGALGPDMFKALPGLRKLFPKNWWDEGTNLRNNKEFMTDAIKYVEVGRVPDHNQIKQVESWFTKGLEKLPKKMLGVKLDPVYDTFLKANKFLFDEYHPRLKIYTWKTYVDEAIIRHAEKGIEITPDVLEQIKRDSGDLVNNQFGGQIKELSRIFNNPTQRKWVQRIVGYPDWTISAAKQAAGFFGPGVKGDMARAYWVRYGMGWLAATAMMKFVMGGFQSKDDENNKVRWNPEHALKAWEDEDPTKWLAFPLPDIKLKIGKVEFNPGRDQKGRKRYAHFGKQALEVPRYFTNFVDSVFSKSSPLIQETYKQMGGSSPFQGESFPVRGVYVNGSMRPWDGTMKGSAGRVASRAVTAVGAFIPFGLRSIGGSTTWTEGVAVWAASGVGSVPVGKGMSLRKSESYIYDALKKNNIGKLNKIVRVLKENGYKMPQIKRTITMIKKFYLGQKKLEKKSKS